MKKVFTLSFLIVLFWSCATYKPPSPSLNVGTLPSSIVTELTLEERILIEDAWKNLKQGKGNKAKKIISKLGNRNPLYHVGLGYAYFVLRKLQLSEESFKTALKNYPEMTLVHLGLAQIYQKTGRENLAFAEYREVLKRESEHPWANEKYHTLKNKKTEEALREAKSALAEGKTERSKEAFLKALHYSPQSTEIHLALSEIYKKGNEPQNAIVHLRAAYQNEPKNKKILKNYAETLFQAEHYPRSLEIYEKLFDLDPKNNKIMERIEYLKSKLGIFELPSQYHTIPSLKAISKEEIAALIAVKFKGIVEPPSTSPPIISDISTSWASKFILQIASLGILEVLPNHTFQPRKIVNRAEMAEILFRLINFLERKGHTFIQQIPPEKINISDVYLDNYYYQPIVHILSYNIMDLYPDRSFKPSLPVSGQKCIKLLDIILALVR